MNHPHSPAPWHLTSRNNCWAISNDAEDIVYVFRPYILDGRPCGSVTTRGRSLEEMEANAWLIAAAPELLEALRDMMQQAEIADNTIHEIDFCKALSAIAKATGGDA